MYDPPATPIATPIAPPAKSTHLQIKVVNRSSSHEFERDCNYALSEGWALFGVPTFNMCACSTEYAHDKRTATFSFIQAFTKQA